MQFPLVPQSALTIQQVGGVIGGEQAGSPERRQFTQVTTLLTENNFLEVLLYG